MGRGVHGGKHCSDVRGTALRVPIRIPCRKTEQRPGELWRCSHRAEPPRVCKRNKGRPELCCCLLPSGPETREFLCFVSRLQPAGCSASDETCLGNGSPWEGWVTQQCEPPIPAVCCSSSPAAVPRPTNAPLPSPNGIQQICLGAESPKPCPGPRTATLPLKSLR